VRVPYEWSEEGRVCIDNDREGRTHLGGGAGWPSFDPSLTSEQRRHYDNGIWMCSNHASLIDEDWRSYSAEQLRAMKHQAEERAADALRRNGSIEGGGLKAWCCSGDRPLWEKRDLAIRACIM